MTGDVAPVKHMKCVVNGILEDEYRKKHALAKYQLTTKISRNGLGTAGSVIIEP